MQDRGDELSTWGGGRQGGRRAASMSACTALVWEGGVGQKQGLGGFEGAHTGPIQYSSEVGDRVAEWPQAA